MTRNKFIIVSLLLISILLYLFTFNMKPSNLTEAVVMDFSKDGFVDASTLENTNKLVKTIGVFELYLDETTSFFKVVNTSTDVVWESNPIVRDPWESDINNSITNSALDKQKSTLEISYFNSSGSLATINNYKYSIYHPKDILNDEGERTFQIKYTENGFQILYIIEDLEIDYLFFPKFLPKDVLEGMEDRFVLEAIAYTGYDEDREIYELVQYENMSKLVKKRLYSIFYEDLNYTREQAISENASYGYNERYEKVRFEIGIDVSLNNEGIEASIIKNSIVEPSNVKLASITFLPLFGTAVSMIDGVKTEGYIVLPDGSGAVLEFNNGKFYQEPYSKRVYGEDLAILSVKMPEQQQKISIPLYGMVKEDAAFAAIITNGDSMATIHADVSGRIDSYNKVYVSFKLRENESITLGSGFNQYGLDLYTEDIVDTDFTVKYIFLDSTESSYVGIANTYQDYLTTQFNFNSTDITTETIVTTEFIGTYDQKEFFLGVPYYSNNSLTTFSQAEIILDELLLRDVSNINVIYSGMINGGISSSLNDRFDIEKELGGKKDYEDLLDYLDSKDISLYPNVKLMTTSDYNKIFDRGRYTSTRIDGSRSLLFKYHLPSKLPYSETQYDIDVNEYVVNPIYFESIMDRLADDYNEDKLSFDMLGSILGGNYDENNILYKQDSLRLQESLLSEMQEEIMLSSPLGFAFPYSSYITDLPMETTLYAILDYQIPLLQLVLSGKIDYSTVSLNLATERSIQYNFLKVIETGSNIKYTLTYDNSKELKNTPYNYYYSTQYSIWLDSIEDTVKELDEIGIHEGFLVDHEKIENNVYKVTYSNGLEIILNYNLSDVTIGINTIPSMDYIVLEVN